MQHHGLFEQYGLHRFFSNVRPLQGRAVCFFFVINVKPLWGFFTCTSEFGLNGLYGLHGFFYKTVNYQLSTKKLLYKL
jgi:hypothetical protein